MAADQTAVRSAHATLTANTARKFNLTGKAGATVEVCHNGGSITDPLFVTTARTEAALVTAVKQAAETEVVMPGERLTIQCPTGKSLWVSIICNTAASVSLVAA